MRLLARNAFEPMAGSSAMPLEAFVFSGQPQYEFAINLPERGIERGLVESAVIILETAVEMAGHAERLVPQRFREICAKYRAVGHKSPRSLRHKAFHLPPLVNCGF